MVPVGCGKDYLGPTISRDIFQGRDSFQRIKETEKEVRTICCVRGKPVYNPAMSWRRSRRACSNSLTVGSFQRVTISSEQACKTTPGSFESLKSMSCVSALDRAVVGISLLNAFFQGVKEFTAISCEPLADRTEYGRLVKEVRWVASKSGDPGGANLRRRASSTCCRGERRILSLRCSEVRVGYLLAGN